MPTDTRARKATLHTGLTWSQAGWFAARRAGWTLSVGMAAAGVWILATFIAPQMEERYWPVVSDLRLHPDARYFSDPDLIAFRVEWTKHCRCPSLGRSWLMLMSDGSMVRVQAQQPENDPTGALRLPGRHVGGLQILRMPPDREVVERDGARSIVTPRALVFVGDYDRGLPWTSHVTAGPYPLSAFRRPEPLGPGQASGPPDVADLP